MKLDLLISSTQRDLREHRDILHTYLLKSGFFVTLMELKGADSRTPLETIRSWVKQADVYVGLLGIIYGTKESTSGKSFTELEYDRAVELQKPRLMYILDKDYKLPISRKTLENATDQEALALFEEKVKRDSISMHFTTPENLCCQVMADLLHHYAPTEGWQASNQAYPKRSKKVQQAVNYLERAIFLDTRQLKYTGALEFCGQAIRLDNQLIFAHYYKVVILRHLGRYEEALNYSEQAQKIIQRVGKSKKQPKGFCREILRLLEYEESSLYYCIDRYGYQDRSDFG